MIWLFLLLASDPVLFQARMSEGIAALGRGDLRRAQVSFEAATKLADDPGAWMMLAQTLARESQAAARGRLRSKLKPWAPATREFFRRSPISTHRVAPDLRKAASRRRAICRQGAVRPNGMAHCSIHVPRYRRYVTGDCRGTAGPAPTYQSEELHTILGRALGSRQDWPAAARNSRPRSS